MSKFNKLALAIFAFVLAHSGFHAIEAGYVFASAVFLSFSLLIAFSSLGEASNAE